MFSRKTSRILLHLRLMRTPPTHQLRVPSTHALTSMRKFRSYGLQGLITLRDWVRLLTWQQSTPSLSVQLMAPLMDKKLKYNNMHLFIQSSQLAKLHTYVYIFGKFEFCLCS